MKKWTITVSTAGLASALLLGGLASTAVPTMAKTKKTSNITGTITVLTNRTDMQANGMLNQYSKEFEKLYPGTKVKWETFVDNNTVQVQMNGGVYPDVMMILPTITPQELPNFFAPLNNLGLGNKLYFNNFEAYQGKVYGIATFGDVNGIVYNKLAFKKAGIKSTPTTLSQFYQDCALLKKAGITPIALNYTDKWPLQYWTDVLPDLISQNANYLNTMVSSNTPFSPNTPMGKSLNVARTIVNKGYAEPDFKNTNWANSKTMMAKGKYAMMFLGNWAVPQVIADGIPSKDVGFFPFPASNNGKNIAILTPDWFLAVNKHSKHIPTAEAFVKWEVTQSGYANYAGGIPTLKSQKSGVPQLIQFEKQASKVIEGLPQSAQWTKISNGAQLDLTGGGAVQTVLTASNFSSALNQMNQAWANAKSLIGN